MNQNTMHDHSAHHQTVSESSTNYTALYRIFLIIFVVSIVVASKEVYTAAAFFLALISNYMIGFLLVFAGMKLLNVSAFAVSFKQYDLLSKKVPLYSQIYPFLEFGLGLWYLITPTSILLNWITIVVFALGSIGVMQALQKKDVIQCACTGTVLDLPISNITLIENVAMVAMAGTMLLIK